MNADEMEAGRELDALVAEKVMEWMWYDGRGTGGPSYWQDKDGEYSWCAYWNPSTEIADAWEVVEALRDKGFIVNILIDSPENSTLVSCSLHKPDLYETMIVEQIAETAPLAICRAALKAVL